jgi:urease accessory protein
LLRLFQLTSAALPIGAFAYSQGLEQAVELGDVTDAEGASRWIRGLLADSILSLDVPVFARLHRAFSDADDDSATHWSAFLFAARGSAELRSEERQVGAALARLLVRQGTTAAERWLNDPCVTLAASFALACVTWRAPLDASTLAYVFAWCEAQVGAATRAIPLGQTDAQSVLAELMVASASALPNALALADHEITSSAHGQLLLSALHETQYSRLFRS